MQCGENDLSFLNKCNFINLTRDTAFNQIVEPIWQQYLDSFSIGRDRLILIPYDANFVIKIPYTHWIHPKRKVFIESKNSLWTFHTENQLYNNFSQIQTYNFLSQNNPVILDNNVTVFTQEKVIISHSDIDFKNMFNITDEKLMTTQHIIQRFSNYPWTTDKKLLIWFTRLADFCSIEISLRFLLKNHIIDIHTGNFGYRYNSYEPVMIDYNQ